MNEGLGTPLNFVSKVSASLSSPHPDPVDQICPLREGVTGDGEGTLDAQQNHLGSFKSSPMAWPYHRPIKSEFLGVEPRPGYVLKIFPDDSVL